MKVQTAQVDASVMALTVPVDGSEKESSVSDASAKE